MKQLLILFFSAVLFIANGKSFNKNLCDEKTSYHQLNQKKPVYTYNTTYYASKMWGYDIYIDKKILIHQPTIPGLAGKEGFKTKSDAGKVARFVIEKLKKGEMPPSVSKEELRALKVL